MLIIPTAALLTVCMHVYTVQYAPVLMTDIWKHLFAVYISVVTELSL